MPHLAEIDSIAAAQPLRKSGGELVEWLGEAALRSLFPGRRDWPIPDALVHWRLRNREGTFLLEWDRGTETVAVLTAKLARYFIFWERRGYREMLPGLGLRPRLAIVLASVERAARLQGWLGSQSHKWSGTIFLGVRQRVLNEPLGRTWWRNVNADPSSELTEP